MYVNRDNPYERAVSANNLRSVRAIMNALLLAADVVDACSACDTELWEVKG